MRTIGLLLVAGLSTLVGCSSDEESTGGSKGSVADCDAIIDACHDKDPGTGDINVCHETAHDLVLGSDFSYCAANKSRCVSLCNAAAEVDGGVGGHSHGGAGGSAGHGHGGTSAGGTHAGGTGGHSHTGGSAGAGGHSHSGGTGGHSHAGAGGESHAGGTGGSN